MSAKTSSKTASPQFAVSEDGQLIAATASATNREDPSESQDRAGVLVNKSRDVLGIVVCDGVGSLPESGSVAESAVKLTSGIIGEKGLKRKCWRKLAAKVNDRLDRPMDGASTHIAVALDVEGRVRFSFLGDGALFEVRMHELVPGNFRPAFSEVAVAQGEYDEFGRWLLNSCLPFEAGSSSEPVVGFRPRQLRPKPQLWLAVSDGVSSNQERPIGLDPEGVPWQVTSRVLNRLLSQLADDWGLLTTWPRGEALAESLAMALETSRAAGHLTDDTTAAAVLFNPAGSQSR